jgi:hypothetical protein
MPKPKKSTSTRLPEDKGIKEIEIERKSKEVQNPNRMTIYMFDTDKAFLEMMCKEKSAEQKRPISKSQVVRWALRNAQWDEFEVI